MAISQAICSTFKQQLFQGVHNFSVGGDAFKLALYTSAATIGASTSVYTVTGEVSSTATNYPAGGGVLTSLGVALTGTTAFLDFNDVTFANVTLTSRGCLIYNTTEANATVAVFDFGSDKTATDGDFTVIFPPPGPGTAVIRLV